MSYTISYVNLRYRIRYLETYDIVGHIVGRDTVLANRTYDIVRPIVYDVVCQTYDIVYDFVFSYDIVGGRTVLANRTSRRRIRYRRFTYDIVYDVVLLCQVDTTSYVDVVFTTDAMSGRYDILTVFRTIWSYDIAITYDMACLARWERPERRRVALAMVQPHPLLLPLDPRPCQMV
jgi:hypothetical protein